MKPRILVVGDEPQIRRFLKTTLEVNGNEVTLALGLASICAAAPALAGGRSGMSDDLSNNALLAGGAYERGTGAE